MKKQGLIVLIISIVGAFSLWLLQASFWVVTISFILAMGMMLYLRVPRTYLWVPILFSLISYQNQSTYLMPFHILISIYLVGMFGYLLYHKKFKKGFLTKPLLILMLYMVVSLFWTNYLKETIVVSILNHTIMGYLIYFIVSSDDESHWNLVEVTQFLSIFSASIALQWMMHKFIAYESLFSNVGAGYDLFSNNNILAGFMVLLVTSSIYKYFKITSWKIRVMFIFFDILSVFVIVLITGSRSATFGLIAGIFFGIWVVIAKETKWGMILVFSSMGVAILGYVVLIVFKTNLLNIYERLNLFSTNRIWLYDIGLHAWSKNITTILFGTGVGSTNYYLNPGANHMYYHNHVLNILFTMGLLGILLHGIIYYKITKYFSNKGLYGKLWMVAYVAYLGYGFVDVGYEYQFIGVVFYGMLAIFEKQTTTIQEIHKKIN